MAFSAALPIAAKFARSRTLGCLFIDWEAMRQMNGSIACADLLMTASDRSVCAPDPRLSTRPGFGVSFASAIKACLASAPKIIERWTGTDPLIDRSVLWVEADLEYLFASIRSGSTELAEVLSAIALFMVLSIVMFSDGGCIRGPFSFTSS
jgi:hypothetical protein